MLPDLLHLGDLEPPAGVSGTVRDGLAFHLHTDAVFHAAPTFRRLLVDEGGRLLAAGLRRGPHRAAAHVGLELLLDGILSRRPGVMEAYNRALDPGLHLRVLRFADPRSRSRWAALRERLAGGALPLSYRDPLQVARRLPRVLGRRARLAVAAGAGALLARWAPGARRRLEHATASLLAEVDRGLQTEGPPSRIDPQGVQDHPAALPDTAPGGDPHQERLPWAGEGMPAPTGPDGLR